MSGFILNSDGLVDWDDMYNRQLLHQISIRLNMNEGTVLERLQVNMPEGFEQ